MRVTRKIQAATALAAAAVGALAAPASAGPMFISSFHGSIAIAVWTSCPEPELGDSCYDTVVIASDAITYGNSGVEHGPHFERDKGDRVILRHFWYDMRLVDGQLGPVITKESFGGTDQGVTVDIDQRLRSASAAAPSIPMHTTDYANDREYDETGSVTADWLPAGELIRLDDRSVYHPGYALFLTSTLGWQVDATATGVDDGEPVTRSVYLPDTTMLSARQVDLEVYQGWLSPGTPLR